MRRLVLLRHARTAAVRAAAFPGDEDALDPAGTAAATALRGTLAGEALCSPLARARRTAELLGLEAVVEPALREGDFGSWAGRAPADVPPGELLAWMTDPDAAPHGGESLRAVVTRVGAWLDGQAALEGRAVAVTHGGAIKAAVVHALGAPLEAFWRVDAAPLHATELHAHDGRWTVTALNRPLAVTA